MNGTILQQGRFTSDGGVKRLDIRSDVDWMEVYNYTVADDDTQTTQVGVQYYWQRGMADGTGIEYRKSNAANADQLVTALASGGFTLLDTSSQVPGPLNDVASGNDITAISAGPPPVVTNNGDNGLSAGDVVRLIDITGGQQLGGIDFTVGNDTLSSTSFSLDYMPAIGAATTGSWRKIPFQPQYYPRKRFITSISQAGSAVIVLSVTHGFTAGQAVRIKVPAAYGMSEIDGLIGNITAVNTSTNSITVDINSSAFSAFAFPLTGGVPFDFAEVIPVGQTADGTYANVLDGATDNVSLIGMELGAGADGPAGSNNDVVYWRAGKSFSVSNE